MGTVHANTDALPNTVRCVELTLDRQECERCRHKDFHCDDASRVSDAEDATATFISDFPGSDIEQVLNTLPSVEKSTV